jgi:phosphomannomutase
VDPALAERVRAWIAADPDPASRAELETLLSAGDEPELRARFDTGLTFGTAGLRGPMRAGPNGMNVAVVRRAAAGLAAFLLATCDEIPSVVIGCDARHHSEEFALDSAKVMAAAGLRVSLLPPRLPTPVLAYAVRALGADAGVMVTASHNPAMDNGYKVYLGGPAGEPASGAQIVPPQDAEIEAAIAAAGPAAALPLTDDFERLNQEIVRSYIDSVVGLTRTAERTLRVAYTPLHGVGGSVLLDVMEKGGFGSPAVVDAQFDPDPDFPTVAFPNPEEPGATDLLLQLSARVEADIAIANDPDADRCAVAVGGHLLSGDELGLLLADHALTHPRPGEPLVAEPLIATTIVSSSALAALAAARGVRAAQTLTGFKWLARAGGEELVFAYEEALGYAVGLGLVRDKDGISAALAVCELAAHLKARGLTLRDRLDELAMELGLFATAQVSVRLTDPDAATAAAQRLLTGALTTSGALTTLGGLRVTGVDDLMATTGGLPPTEGVRLQLDGGRVIVRPSGTEPKIKAYLEVVTPPEIVTKDLLAARAAATERLHQIAAELRPLLT